MKATQFLKVFCLSSILMTSLASCNQKSGENDKQYTPLYVYFNPLELDMKMETLMPYFVNYPSDLTKMGIRKHPMNVTYEHTSSAWGITTMFQYVFLIDGNLSEYRRTSFNVGANGLDVTKYEYDDNSNLIGITAKEDGYYRGKKTDDGFTYDSANRLIRRDKNGRGNYNTSTLLYSYHENGMLKSVLPEKENNTIYESGVTLWKMQFDSLAHMVRFETPNTTNIFLKDINEYYKGKSVTTYTYIDNLCTQAVERIPIKFDKGTETLTCTSKFAYNSHGDLTKWTYSGGVYKKNGNNWRVDNMEFTINYDYKYDNQGNWTEAKIIFPANIDEIPALRIHYKASTTGYSSQDKSPSVKQGETPSLNITRTVEYWSDELVEAINTVKAYNNENTTKAKSLLYSDTDIYGIIDKVKTVQTETSFGIYGGLSRLDFDKSGNLVHKENPYTRKMMVYQYNTPTSYTVEGWSNDIVNITISKGKRIDKCKDEVSNGVLGQECRFDDQGRIVWHKFTDANTMAFVTLSYKYEDKSKYPVTMIEDHPENGVTTYDYTYTKFDDRKNWTEREVLRATEYDQYDDNMNYIGKMQTPAEVYTEKRNIEYW